MGEYSTVGGVSTRGSHRHRLNRGPGRVLPLRYLVTGRKTVS